MTAIILYVPKLTLSLVQHRCVTTRGTVASWHIAASCTAHQSDSCQDTICSRRLFRIYISLQKDLSWRIITLTGRWRAKNRFSYKSSSHCQSTRPSSPEVTIWLDADTQGSLAPGRDHSISQHCGESPHSQCQLPHQPQSSPKPEQGSLFLPRVILCMPKESLTKCSEVKNLHKIPLTRRQALELQFWGTITECSSFRRLTLKWGCYICHSLAEQLVTLCRPQPVVGPCLPGMLEMQSTWALQTVNWSTTVPGWLASMITTLLVDRVLVRIQTRLDVASISWNSFAFRRANTGRIRAYSCLATLVQAKITIPVPKTPLSS